AAEPLRQAIKKKETDKPAPLDRIAATFEPTNAPVSHHLLVRGSHASEGKEVVPGTPAVFGISLIDASVQCAEREHADAHSLKESTQSSGRRLALARWATSPSNPIVARV